VVQVIYRTGSKKAMAARVCGPGVCCSTRVVAPQYLRRSTAGIYLSRPMAAARAEGVSAIGRRGWITLERIGFQLRESGGQRGHLRGGLSWFEIKTEIGKAAPRLHGSETFRRHQSASEAQRVELFQSHQQRHLLQVEALDPFDPSQRREAIDRGLASLVGRELQIHRSHLKSAARQVGRNGDAR